MLGLSRRARGCGLLLLFGLAAALDECSEKPTFDLSKCPHGHAIACWSLSPNVTWLCWTAEWAPAWSLNQDQFAADADCQSQATPLGSASLHYDGACQIADAYGYTRPLEPLSWHEAYEKAAATLAQMNETEKAMLMRGIGWYKTKSWFDLEKWWYVGNTAPIPRLGIPSLNMQDAADGFRTYWTDLVGTVTAWPSLLSMAATWDPAAVKTFAEALGEEFSGKGANVILGPSVNVHRVARNGRNFEYLSGEDPYLGAQLAAAYVSGTQSKGVMSVSKHWVMNEQETHRDKESSNVDEKTMWELYYPPFEATVDIGVGSFMCSYNKVNTVYSCSNPETIDDLKGRMGFKGFVMSDWWATHGTTVEAGLDQMQPGTITNKTAYFTLSALKRHDQAAIDSAVERILAAMYKLKLENSTKCSPPDCEEWYSRNVTSQAHVDLARSLATESIVMLQNRRSVLPLSAGISTIAVIGPAANSSAYNPAGNGQDGGTIWNKGDYYSGGGSGHVVAGSIVTPLDGITRRAELAGIRVITSLSNDTDAAIAAAQAADVAIVVGATTCGEAMDRTDLNLDDGMDAVIGNVSQYARDVVVLLAVPGTVLMPWHDSVSSILTSFFLGQETGNAWASVLFGDHAPTGRLPIMIPVSEADTIAPGEGRMVDYTEGLATSYRNPTFRAVFPFGHGLTFTTFEYGNAWNETCGDMGSTLKDVCIFVMVKNTGESTGKTIAQLYMEFPPAAGHPAAFLKGFQKTPSLAPNETHRVRFRLNDRDLSYYDPQVHGWRKVDSATAHIGESQGDIRQSLHLVFAAEPEGRPAITRLWRPVVAIVVCVTAVAVMATCLCGQKCCRASHKKVPGGLSSEESDLEDSDASVRS